MKHGHEARSRAKHAARVWVSSNEVEYILLNLRCRGKDNLKFDSFLQRKNSTARRPNQMTSIKIVLGVPKVLWEDVNWIFEEKKIHRGNRNQMLGKIKISRSRYFRYGSPADFLSKEQNSGGGGDSTPSPFRLKRAQLGHNKSPGVWWWFLWKDLSHEEILNGRDWSIEIDWSYL